MAIPRVSTKVEVVYTYIGRGGTFETEIPVLSSKAAATMEMSLDLAPRVIVMSIKILRRIDARHVR